MPYFPSLPSSAWAFWAGYGGWYPGGGTQVMRFTDDEERERCWKCNKELEETPLGVCKGCLERLRDETDIHEESTG